MSKADVILSDRNNKLIVTGMAKYPNETIMHPRALMDPGIAMTTPMQVTAVEYNYLSLEQPYSTDLRLQCFDCHFESYHLHHHSRRLAVPDVTRDMGECKQ